MPNIFLLHDTTLVEMREQPYTEQLLTERVRAIHEQGRAPLISVDMDDTLLPFGQLITSKELPVLRQYAQAGGHLAFNTLAPKEWFYRRVVEQLALVFHQEGCPDLLGRLHWIASGGAEIFVYHGPDESYRRVHTTAAGTKATGVCQLRRYLGDTVAILALYGDRFDDPGNDGNAIGHEDVPLIINVGADQEVKSTAKQVFINSVEKGPSTTLRHLELLTSRLRDLQERVGPNKESVPVRESSRPKRTWRFETADESASRGDTAVEVEVHGPGFVWSWNPNSLSWLTPLLPDPGAEIPSYRAPLPPDATHFTFFWTGGEDTKSGHSPGHWEGRDFVVNGYAEARL